MRALPAECLNLYDPPCSSQENLHRGPRKCLLPHELGLLRQLLAHARDGAQPWMLAQPRELNNVGRLPPRLAVVRRRPTVSAACNAKASPELNHRRNTPRYCCCGVVQLRRRFSFRRLRSLFYPTPSSATVHGDAPSRYRTIMAYATQATSSEPCQVSRVNYFSSPDVTYNDRPTGNSQNDNVQCIRSSMVRKFFILSFTRLAV